MFKIIATVILITATGEREFVMEYGSLVFPNQTSCELFVKDKQPELQRGVIQAFKFYDESLKDIKEIKCQAIK